MRIGYLECFSGVSGDMLLGALVDAGVPFALLEETASRLNVGARLEMRKVSRGGLAATKVDVIAPPIESRVEPDPAASAHAYENYGEHAHESHPHAGDAHEEVFHEPGAHSYSHPPEPAHSHAHPHSPAPGHTHGEHRSLSQILAMIHTHLLYETQ